MSFVSTHTYALQPQGKIKVAICNHQTDWPVDKLIGTCALMSDLVNCKHIDVRDSWITFLRQCDVKQY